MKCRLCGHPKPHKHGLMPSGHQRYFCPTCQQTFSLKFRHALLLATSARESKFNKSYSLKREGSSLRGISRITGLAYNTVVSIVRQRQC